MLKKKRFSLLPLVKVIAVAIISLVGFSIVIVSLDYYEPDFTKGYLSDKEEVFNGIFSVGLYAHITAAPILLLISSIQVFRKQKSDLWHLLLGNCYLYGVLLIGGPSGVILSFYAFGGIAGKLSFLTLSVLWMLFTYSAYVAIQKNEKRKHLINSSRSYTLLLSAIFLRIISFIFINYTGVSLSANTYFFISLLSWLPSLLVIEIMVRYKINVQI